jgi:hypothetical protein
LYNCADIQVIDSTDGFLTAERLKSFQVQSVSIVDVLHCFPCREETTNEFRQQFRLWAQKQDEHWWSQFFYHIAQTTATSQISNIMVQKPIFLLSNDQQRQYLPINDGIHALLFISDDDSFRMWKRQLTLLRYASKLERTALLNSKQVQLLTDERMIEIIQHDHLQLAMSSADTSVDVKLIEEVWQDLFYLQSRLHLLNTSNRFLVPVNGTSSLTAIQNAVLPTILGVDIRLFMYATTSPIVLFPYYGVHHNQLIDNLQWEYFLLEMNCQRPSIHLPLDYTITQVPLLPSFSMFTDEKCARFGELILSFQTENTRDCLRQFPIVDNSNSEQQISPVSATFDESIVRDLPSLPRITLSSHCRSLAIQLGVCVEYDLRTCVTILQLLSDEKNTNIDLYIQWLGHLQLYVRQQHVTSNKNNLLLSCRLYFPEQQQFCSLKDLLVVASDNAEHRDGILLVSIYLKLQLISPSINQIYWQFKDLFRLLGCICAVSIVNIHTTIYLASHDKTNFFALGDCTTTLTENGMEKMITLFQYLEDLIMKCVKDNVTNIELYRAVVENKHPTAPCGSREDLEWRFGFTCNSLSRQLKQLTGIQVQRRKIGLLTIDRQIITKKTDNIVYACLETKIIHNLSKNIGKRYFILPSITRSCPLVLATFEVDYVERRGKLEWIHKNHNLEYHLTQLTNIFCNAVNDPQLQVIASKYAIVTLLLSDSFVIDSTDRQDKDEINRYMVDSDYPFWIFDKIILLCTGNEKHDAPKAIIATSALATLLHRRKHAAFEEAKSIAQQKISACTVFQSNALSPIASTGSTVYSYTDLLFPTDHQSIESMAISIGRHCDTEQDPEETTTTTVAADRISEDRVYRNRARTEDHTRRNGTKTNTWSDSTIVDNAEKTRIGQNAEHFFFVYLQTLYGSVDVTPTQNWRSSSRLVFYPQYRRNVNDAAGYDLELRDTREVFVHGSGSTTKHCYFEVKGTSGVFNVAHTRFHISQNEFERCEAIANDGRRREREAYFIVIIQNCLDAEKISFGTTINWYRTYYFHSY